MALASPVRGKFIYPPFQPIQNDITELSGGKIMSEERDGEDEEEAEDKVKGENENVERRR